MQVIDRILSVDNVFKTEKRTNEVVEQHLENVGGFFWLRLGYL